MSQIPPCWCWIYNCKQRKINGSTSFTIDNMCHISFWIREQENVPWSGENQNRRSEVLEKTFNLHSNSTRCPRCVVSQLVTKGWLVSDKNSHTFTCSMMFLLFQFWTFFPFVSNQLSNWAGLLGLTNWA